MRTLRRLSPDTLPPQARETPSTVLRSGATPSLRLPSVTSAPKWSPLSSVPRLHRVRPTRLKILDFDIECRPLAVTASAGRGAIIASWEITAIAAKWIGDPPETTRCWLLGDLNMDAILDGFLEMYDEANQVVGHYIRGFDLPRINSALHELRRPPLDDKQAHDTKLDLVSWDGLSKSQENIAARLGVAEPKIHMNEALWREANRLGSKGLERSYTRVVGDVLQNEAMYAVLKDDGWLKIPVVWRSVRSGISGSYAP